MNKLYGIIQNNYVITFLTSDSVQEAPWVELNTEILETKPSPTAKFNYDQQVWETLNVDLLVPQWYVVREQRNQLLQESDWTQLPDVPLSTKESWATYRQQLRDVTTQPDPFNITWPTAPA
jgi:hypothetical protein